MSTKIFLYGILSENGQNIVLIPQFKQKKVIQSTVTKSQHQQPPPKASTIATGNINKIETSINNNHY